MITRDALQNLVHDVHTFGINASARQIYLHSIYGVAGDDEEPGIEYRLSTTFIKNLHILDSISSENILVYCHSIGGSWSDGMAAFDAIRASKSPVTILGYAQASSMSGVLLQAADKRVLSPSCEFMIHYGSIYVDDNSLAAKSAVDANERYSHHMLKIFATRAMSGKFFKSREYNYSKVSAYINRKIRDKSDWYLSAEEAVDYGFADGILGEKGFESVEKIRIGKKYRTEKFK
jgi:ATP-dependent Clp protease protease subunit